MHRPLPHMRAIAPLAVVLAAALAAAGCATETTIFMHRSHRLDFRISAEEIQGLQFFLGSQVLAHQIEPPTGVALLMHEGTPGVPIEVGPDWIRVRFQRGELITGVVFMADPESRYGAPYFLASAQPDGTLVPMRDVKDQLLRLGDQTWRVKHGESARLQIRQRDLNRIMESRATVRGARQ